MIKTPLLVRIPSPSQLTRIGYHPISESTPPENTKLTTRLSQNRRMKRIISSQLKSRPSHAPPCLSPSPSQPTRPRRLHSLPRPHPHAPPRIKSLHLQPLAFTGLAPPCRISEAFVAIGGGGALLVGGEAGRALGDVWGFRGGWSRGGAGGGRVGHSLVGYRGRAYLFGGEVAL
jgi:hypothetical protein